MYRDVAHDMNNMEQNMEGPNEEAKSFFKLVDEGQEELYPGYKKFSKLPFTIRCTIISVSMESAMKLLMIV